MAKEHFTVGKVERYDGDRFVPITSKESPLYVSIRVDRPGKVKDAVAVAKKICDLLNAN